MESIVIPEISTRKFNNSLMFDFTSPEYDQMHRNYRYLKPRLKPQDPKLVHLISPQRVRWDIFIICLALYNCYSVPYSLAFETNSSHVLLICFDLIVDILFVLDIYYNFRTSYIDRKGEEILDRKRIAKNYASSGRLFTDILACAPVSLIDYIVGVYAYISILKLLKITRILRINKIIQYMRISQEIKLPLRICKLIVYFLFCVHLNACSWKAIISADRSWVSPSFTINQNPYSYYELSYPSQYLFCIYFSICILLGIEILPQNTSNYIYCSVVVIFGALFFSYIFGEIAVLVIDIKKNINQFSVKMDSVFGIIYKLKLNQKLRNEIIDYFKDKYRFIRKNEEWSSFSDILSKSFMKEINEFMFRDIIFSIRTLSQFPTRSKAVISKLKYGFLRPSDCLIEAGAESKEFFIILEGEFDVWVEGLDNKDYFMRRLSRSDYCGEIGILYNQRRTASVLSISHSTIGYIAKKDFLDLINETIEIELKRTVGLYKDPYRMRIIQLMKRVPYLKKIDSLAMNALIYSIKIEHFEEETVVFEDAAIARQVLFILDGTVQISSNLYDLDLQRRISMRCATENVYNTQLSYGSFKRSNSRRRSVRNTLRFEKIVNLSLCTLGEDSILCGIQALFDKKLNVNCCTLTRCRVLVLKIEDVYEVAKENIRLRMAVNNIKKNYIDRVSGNECNHFVPELDCYKRIHDEIFNEKKNWKLSKKWKNAVLMIVMKNRRQFKIKPATIKRFTHRIKSLEAAAKKKWINLAKKIDVTHISYDSLKFADYLPVHQSNDPIFREFALLAMEFTKSYEIMSDSFENMNEQLNKTSRRRERLRVKIKEIKDIITLIYRYF